MDLMNLRQAGRVISIANAYKHVRITRTGKALHLAMSCIAAIITYCIRSES
ncbi:Hypothetical protein GbCGDNIH2_5087 [Granulibacter bethesdensis]|uniref:Uncharacterized protein n=1 Tax=Granulibacter bethesdensis (strain ATCC BAA-1260 / CGDNIH1) TaxID=391165 RepID=A0A286M309_GRABC|nr:Hypothetical protein GbCGDNIH2_5087 [Granulibacter bethesdensis]APH51901.1 Hypothetical protein GbCGDNIH5_5087 [Granulibacter bethesdensis]APH64591.1 Hypothetical protein GbCGDNIH1I4_5087 [Granulibacter bethesdensis]ASV62408.1 Hypothetical protein GbCGDNIH1_5087 [Granulibacter bethesdensis CGDNIH1]